jgi:formamidopyrimidine-DNA glycosylase
VVVVVDVVDEGTDVPPGADRCGGAGAVHPATITTVTVAARSRRREERSGATRHCATAAIALRGTGSVNAGLLAVDGEPGGRHHGRVPELPEVQALVEFLDERLRSQRIERCELGAIAALKTFDPSLKELVGRTFTSCTRRGKFVCFDADGLWLVVHLALGGWVKWWDTLPATKARPSRSPIALRVGLEAQDFAPSPGFDVTEMGTEKRLALWVVHDPEEVEPLASLGPDPLDPAFDTDALAAILATASGTIKNALSTQSLIAGVGNAYSDEILHAAKLSPFKPAARLNAEELARVHDALVFILSDAMARASGHTAKELKGDKKRAMRVHGRTGEACPVCGDVVREVSFATKSLQYCATCQTGGKPLADRRLSRLLK